MKFSIEIWQFWWFFDTHTSFGANLPLGKFGLGKYGSGQIWSGQTWVLANLASGKFGSGQTWAGANVAGQTWSGKIWFGQTWDVIRKKFTLKSFQFFFLYKEWQSITKQSQYWQIELWVLSWKMECFVFKPIFFVLSRNVLSPWSLQAAAGLNERKKVCTKFLEDQKSYLY